MARKYARDNRGRFAPKGSGATARGGRLKTASGKKREAQTMQAKGSNAGTIGKPKGLKPGALKPKAAAPVNRAGQASRGLARASKSAMESRRLQATGGAFKSPAAKAKMDRTNKIAADAQAFYSTGKGAKPAAKSAGKPKPLTGVNSIVGRNLAGFKGLPVSLRSRKDAAAAQRQRNRRTIEATRSQVIGARRGVTSTAGGGQKLRVTRGQSQQMNLLTGKTDTVARINAKPVPTNTGAAPGSKSRRRSFGAMTRKMESPSSALGRRRLRASALEGARKKATPYNTKKAAKTLATKGKALSFYESLKRR